MKTHSGFLEEDSVFQSFSDIIFCVCVLLILFVVVLAINVTTKIDSLIAMNRFSGGYQRPVIYMDAWNAPESKGSFGSQIYGKHRIGQVLFMSPSLALAATTVDDDSGDIYSMVEGESFSGGQLFSVSEALELLSGIDPGEFSVDGKKSILLKPITVGKNLYLSAREPLYPSSNELAAKILELAWPVMKNPLFPVRAFEEYREARTRVFVSVERNKNFPNRKVVYIGQTKYTIPEAINNGRLSFLTALSSAATEIVYLGELAVNDDDKSNSIINFFRENGFKKEAEAYLKYRSGDGLPKEYLELTLPAMKWAELPEEKKEHWINSLNLDELEAKKKFERVFRRMRGEFALDLALTMQLMTYELEDIKKELIPPLIRYPKAWKAYIKHKLKKPSKPPQWFYDEFLIPLGFDRRVVNIKEDKEKNGQGKQDNRE